MTWLLLWLLGYSPQAIAPRLPRRLSTQHGHAPKVYRVSFYCPCRRCTGGAPKPTKSGRWPKAGVTVAADPRLHPLGSWVTVEGLGKRRVDDTGSAIKGERLDVYMESHEAALRAGVWRREVW